MKIKTVAKENTTLFVAVSQCAPISSTNVKKLIKAREVKVNGVRVSVDVQIKIGDQIEAFVPQAFLGEMPQVVFEDENVLIVDKPSLIEVEPTLTELIKGDREYIRPLHRLDRNTTGLVVFALNEKAYLELFDAFKSRTVQKFYKALVLGKIEPGEYSAYLYKDEKNSHCYVSASPKVGYKKIITRVCSCESDNGISLIDVQLVTGRTHQIRAHMAFLGCPILGDGKYGNNEANKRHKAKYQMLCAYKLIFKDLRGDLSYLNEKVFQSERKTLTKQEQ